MEKIPTINELFIKQNPQDGVLPKWASAMAIEFAKLHVQAALKQASENVEFDEQVLIRQSILQSYPLTNIK